MKKKIKIGPIIIILYTIILLSMTYFEFALERAVEISALFIIGTVIVSI